ncbi:hypothetical protein STVIR_3771 [Streptomyces viridochromogenes Tue57]|uniref:Uncharacterized protein n=1 Tax=Streptomyces viridochromogenes Tue57 TaxID=1160705 RepID=L8PCK9_STRVR|nr:hypothetical protein STVIR_3771 [Streptomyces viridochromogenes Tue57]
MPYPARQMPYLVRSLRNLARHFHICPDRHRIP